MRRMFDQIYYRMGIRQLRGLIVLGTDHQTLLGVPPFVSLTDIFLAKNVSQTWQSKQCVTHHQNFPNKNHHTVRDRPNAWNIYEIKMCFFGSSNSLVQMVLLFSQGYTPLPPWFTLREDAISLKPMIFWKTFIMKYHCLFIASFKAKYLWKLVM